MQGRFHHFESAGGLLVPLFKRRAQSQWGADIFPVLWRRGVDLGTGKGNHIVEPKTSVASGSREGQPQTRVRPKHGKCRGRFQNRGCNSHIALALRFSEKKIPKRTEIGLLVSVPSSRTSGRFSGRSGPDRRWAGRSYGFAGQNCAGAARS